MEGQPAVPAAELADRRKRLQARMQAADLGGLFLVDRVNRYYLTGTAQSGFVYLPAEGETLLCVRKFYPRARGESPLERIESVASVREVPGLIHDGYGGLPERLGCEFDVLTVRQFRFFRKLLRPSRCEDASELILAERAIKSAWEIGRMREVALKSESTFAFMREVMVPGLTEMELAGMIETHARRLGHGGMLQDRNSQYPGYPWHVLSGDSAGMVGALEAPASGRGTSAAFPYGAGAKRLVAGEPIMIDFGFVYNGYHMDETRMFAIGAMPEAAERACQAACELHDRLLEMVRPGARVAELFEQSVAMAGNLGYADAYLGPPGAKVSFVGHGIGLELVEPPFIARGRGERLAAGMTLALEPKLVFPGRFGAGIESVFQVTADGARLLSRVPAKIFYCGRGAAADRSHC